MANDIITIVCAAAALYILMRVVFAAAELNVRAWNGHLLRLLGLVSWRALAAAGGVAVAAGAPIGGPLLLMAVALLYLVDRRVQ
ncbi:MAG: hypothetical protein HZC22_13430 [Rhodocyclales bacterium]|nr:hypothetical protein [Rhodocyclales bacterium]